MQYEFRFPDVGEGIAEGEIVEWKVRPGDRVEAHQTLVVVETDKAVVEIPSPVAGRVLETRGEPGDVIRVGDVLAVLDTEGTAEEVAPEAPKPGPGPGPADIPVPGGRPKAERPKGPAAPVVRPSVGVVGRLEEAPEDEGEEAGAAPEPAGARPLPRRAKVLPRDRLLARELGVDVDRIEGTGPGGRVTEADIRRAAAEGRPGRGVTPVEGRPDRDAHGPVERVKLRGVRRRVAENMVRSLATAAQVTTTDEARIGLLVHILEKERARAGERGVRLTLLSFVLKATASALGEVPWLNSGYDDEAGEVVLKRYVNLGVAVETPDGLVVPVVRDADKKPVLEIARDLQDLARRARERTLTLEELRGGTFTVSNYGSIGGIFATPILNPGEAGLLGVGRAREALLVDQGAIRPGWVLPLSLTFDHRIVDGATAQRFLREVVRNLEDPDRVLLGG